MSDPQRWSCWAESLTTREPTRRLFGPNSLGVNLGETRSQLINESNQGRKKISLRYVLKIIVIVVIVNGLESEIP